jgi:hypothetical protein
MRLNYGSIEFVDHDQEESVKMDERASKEFERKYESESEKMTRSVKPNADWHKYFLAIQTHTNLRIGVAGFLVTPVRF